MGMFDYFRFAGPLPDGFVPDDPDDFQTKDGPLDLQLLAMTADRRVIQIAEHKDGPKVLSVPVVIDDKYFEFYGGDHKGYDHNYVCRVSNGVLGPIYAGTFSDMRRAEEARDEAARRGNGKRHIPKKLVKYISKAERERRRKKAHEELGKILAISMLENANRKGLMRRFLEMQNAKV